jgi:outer membrane protein OmpA-like peptidoglycan-associated protein
MFRNLLLILYFISLSGIVFAYPDPDELGRQIERLEEYLQKAQAAEGPECAPESLASAQSHLARAKEEFQEGDLWEAEDAIHRCEKEANGIWEKILACGKDMDRDGIPDRRDQCLKEPESYNTYMDDDGCPDRIPQKAVLTTDKIEVLVPILFDDQTHQPLPDSEAILVEVARIMRENTPLRFRIQAHMDDRLPPGQADSVTERRADSVKSTLVGFGVADERLEAEGRGSRDPLASNDSSWGRILNQRVEFIRIR